MNYGEIKRLFLKVFLGFLGLTAFIAIVSVLSDFGGIQFESICTCLTISIASICSMSCAAFIEKKKRVALGVFGIILSVSSALLLIVGLWMWQFIRDIIVYWKIAYTLGLFAIGFAYSFLLSLPDLDEKQKWVQRVSVVSIGILTIQIVAVIWGEIQNEGYYQILTALSIVVGLETVAIPILAKMRKGNGQKISRLVLIRLEGDIYTDSSGKKYQLKELDSENDNKR